MLYFKDKYTKTYIAIMFIMFRFIRLTSVLFQNNLYFNINYNLKQNLIERLFTRTHQNSEGLIKCIWEVLRLGVLSKVKFCGGGVKTG